MPMASRQNNYSGGGKTKSGTQVSTKARRQDNPSGGEQNGANISKQK